MNNVSKRTDLWIALLTAIVPILLIVPAATAQETNNPTHSEIESKLFQQIAALEAPAKAGDTSLWQTELGGNSIALDPSGLNVGGRSTAGEAWDLSLQLVAHGRRGALADTQAGRLRSSSSRAELDRGEIKEWIARSGRHTLAQGLVLNRPPYLERDGQLTTGNGELLFDFLLSGTFTGAVQAGGQGLDLRDGVRRFHYGELSATDAGGRELPIRLELLETDSRTVLRLRVNDAAADYPITMLASLEEVKKLIQPSAGIGEWAGWDVAIDGDTAVVGAPFADIPFIADAGKAYVFERNQGGPDNWGLVKELTPSDPQTAGNFGNAVTIQGDLIAVGANRFDDFLAPFSGRAYLFSRDQGGLSNWGEIKVFQNPNPVGGENFAWALDLDGDTLVIGAASADLPFLIDAGKAYIFQQDEGGFGNWGLVKTLNAPTPAGVDQFGYDVAIDGDTLVVGADLDDIGLEVDAGAAYIFERNQGGPDFWGLITTLTANDGKFGDRFGVSVAIDGDTIVAGAWFDDEAGSDSGSAYIFERDLGGANFWGLATKIEASDRAAGDNFGISVAIQGDLILVGAHNDDSPAVNAGSAYRFGRDEGGAGAWGEIDQFIPDVLPPGDNFGRRVAISGERILVSAQLDDDAAADAGASYIFEAGDTADLSITMDDSPDPVVAGGALTYTVTVENNGPDTATGVQVMHTLPVEVGALTSSGCAEDGAFSDTCSLDPIASGASVQYIISGFVDAGASGSFNHSASVTAATDDPVQGNNSTTENTLIGGGGGGNADLALISQDSADPVEPGQTLIYTVSVLNNGPGLAQNIQVSQTLPPNVTFVKTTGCAEDNNGVPTCSLGTNQLPGTGRSFTVEVVVNGDASGELTYTGVVTSSTLDPIPASNTRIETTTIGSGTANIEVVISDSADPATAGDPLTYTIEVLNNGPDPAPATFVEVNLPGSLGSPMTTGCAEDPMGTAGCSLGEIAPGSSKTFTVDVQIDPMAAGTLVVEAEASSSASDPIPSNNTATESTEVQPMGEADLFVYQTDSADPIDAGESLMYTVVVGNRGPAAAQNVQLSTVVSDQVGNPTTEGCEGGAGGVPLCSLGTIPAGQNKVVKITVQVSSAASGTLVNEVSVSSANTDPDETNNSATETTTVVAAPGMADLFLSVEDTPDPATPGESLEYKVTVINLGPHEAGDVIVSSVLPAALQNLQVTGCMGDSNNGTSCSLGSIAANGVVEFKISGDLDLNATGTLSFSATATSSTEDPDPSNNDEVEITDLETVALADLEISLVDAQDPVAPGTSAVYTVSVKNNGPDEATGVVVAGAVVGTIGTAVTTGCDEDPSGLASCTLGTIASGATVTFELEVPVPVGTTDTELSTTVTVSSDVADTDSDNNEATETTAIDDSPPVVENLTSIGDTGGSLDECEEARVDISRLLVTFDQSMSDPAGDSDPSDVTNPVSYQLMAAGPDRKLSTSQCGPDQDDDVRVAIGAVTYDDGTFTATLQLDTALDDGPYRLMVCGDTLADASGTVLDGNDNGSSGGDFERYFRIDTSNLFDIGHFDCNLDGWTKASTSENEIVFSAFDVDGALESGAAVVNQLGSTQTFALGQCVELPRQGNYRTTGNIWLRDLATGDSLMVTRECQSFAEADCLGADLGTESFSQTLTDITTGWDTLDGWDFKTASGSASALCSVNLNLDGGDELTVLIDDLVMTDQIFADGFETGDTSLWSETNN